VPTPADHLLAELAVKNHLISEAERDSCLGELEAQSGLELGELLVQKKMLKERHLRSLRKRVDQLLADREAPTTAAGTASSPAPAPEVDASSETFVTGPAAADGSGLLSQDAAAIVLFGQIAHKMNLLSEHDLQRALRLQEHLAAQGRPMRLGEILVNAKRMTEAQVHQVLRYQELYIVRCTVCSRRFNMSASQEHALRCGHCGGGLVQASTGVAVSGTHAGVPEKMAPLDPSLVSKPDLPRERHAPTADDPAGLVGVFWKGYQVEEVLGRGGMGAVYRSLQDPKDLARPVALKVMLRAAAQAAPGERERFEREAKLLANLSHPNIAYVYEGGWEEDLCWFTMELVAGQDFKKVLRSGKSPMRKGAEVVAKVARAMEFAHRKGIIHRDLKPQNVMIEGETGEPKVLDFGLAKDVGRNAMEQLTQMGAFLGTPAYMAPEQAGGDPNAIDARADVYALAAMLYEVLTGRPPFTGKKAIHVIRKVLKEDPVSCRQVFEHANAELEAVAMKGLSKAADDRFQSAGELADAIEAVIGRVSRGAGGRQEKPDEAPPQKKGLLGRLLGG